MSSQQLNLNSYDIGISSETSSGISGGQNDPAKTETRFFRRQFQPQATRKQQVFDWAFGVVLPVICFTFDPVVFRPEASLLGAFKYPAYILSFCSVMGLLAFLLFGEKLRSPAAPLSGLFFASSVISLIVGIAILPFSVLGMIILIGALGFIPFFTSFALWRNGARAYQMAETKINGKLAWRLCLLSVVFSICLPTALGGIDLTRGRAKDNLSVARVWGEILGFDRRF